MKRVLLPTILLAASLISASSQTNQLGPVAPDKDVIAVVLGKPIYRTDKDKIGGLIKGPLREEYIKQNKLEATEAEIEVYVQKTNERSQQQHKRLERLQQQQDAEFEQKIQKLIADLESPSLSEEQRKAMTSRLETMQRASKARAEKRSSVAAQEVVKSQQVRLDRSTREMASNFVSTWKYYKSLYEKYGGRIILKASDSAEPFDACRQFLKDQEKKGAFKILDKDAEAVFWRYYTNDAAYTFYTKDDGAKLIDTPWWLREQPIGK